MSVVGSIAVNIVARTAAFAQGIGATRKNLKQFQKSVVETQSAVGKFSGVLAGLGGAFVTGAIASSLRDTAERLDAVAKTADRIGISTEALSGLQHGAGLAGVDVGLLDKSLQGMVKRVSEAAKGTGDAVGAIAELKLNAGELARMAPDRVLGRIADGLGQVTQQSDKVRIATKLFGEEGASLLNFLSEGSGAIAKYRQEAERMGLAVKREDIAKVEAMNDALSRLGGSWEGTKRELVITLAPEATKFVDGLRESVRGLQLQQEHAAKRGGSTLMGFAENVLKGEAWFQKPITNWMVNRDIRAGVQMGDKTPVTLPGQLGQDRAKLRNPFTPEQADVVMRRQAMKDAADSVIEQNRQRREWWAKTKLSQPASWLMNPQHEGGAISKLTAGLQQLNQLQSQAWQAGGGWKQWALNQFFRGGSKATQAGTASTMPLGGNEIAERGTQAAYQASKASDQVGKILREQLAVAKQQVEHLATIASAANGGDTFSMGAA